MHSHFEYAVWQFEQFQTKNLDRHKIQLVHQFPIVLLLHYLKDHQFASRSIDPSVHCIFLAEFIVSWRDSHPQCSATFKCTHPGLVDDFAEHIQLEELFGK